MFKRLSCVSTLVVAFGLCRGAAAQVQVPPAQPWTLPVSVGAGALSCVQWLEARQGALKSDAALLREKTILSWVQGYLVGRASNAKTDMVEEFARKAAMGGLPPDSLQTLQSEAQRQGITVTDAEVNRTAEQQIQAKIQQLGGEEKFRQQLIKENITEDKLRDKYRKDVRLQMLGQRLLAKPGWEFDLPEPAAIEAWLDKYSRDHLMVPVQEAASVLVREIETRRNASTTQLKK